MDTTKERARRKTSAERALDKQLKAEYAQLKAAQAALPPDPPEDLSGDTFTIYEMVRPDGTVFSRYFSRRLAHHALLSWNSLRCDDEPAIVRERHALLCSLQFSDLQVGIFAPDGLLVRTESFDDPREGFCKHYNERSKNTAKPLGKGGDA